VRIKTTWWRQVPMSFPFDRPIHLGRWAALALLLAVGLAHAALANPQGPGTAQALATPPAPTRKTLSGGDSKRVDELNKTIDALRREGKFAEAIEPARKILAIRQKALGPDHWQAVDACRAVDDLRSITALPE
jgi:hypothetical protein